MLRRRHHGALGHVLTVTGATGVTLGGASAPPPGPGVAGRRGLRALARDRIRRLATRRRTPAAPAGRRGRLRLAATGLPGLTGNVALQEGVRGGPPGPPPSTAGTLFGEAGALGAFGGGVLGVRHQVGDRAGSAAERYFEHVRAAAHARHLVGLEHTAVRPHDPAHDRLVHRVSPGVRPAHLDPCDLTALRGRDHDGVVQITARGDGSVAGGVHARHVRHKMGERGREPLRVDLGLDGRRVHGELHAPRPDQFDGPVHTGGHDGVEHHLRTGDVLGAGVQALIAEDVVDEGGDARVPGREVVQHLVGLGPQLPGVVRGQGGQVAPQLVQRPAQGPAEQREQLLVAPGEGLVPVLLPLAERGVPLLAGRQLLLVPLAQFVEFGDVLLAQRGQVGGVLLGEPLHLLGLRLLQRGLLLGEGVVGPPVGEGHDGADELVAVAHGRGGQIDRDLLLALGPHHLPAHPVLAPGAQGVGERRLLVREGGAVGAGVQHEGVQLLAAQLTGPVPQYLGGGRIDEHDPPVGVGPHDTLRGRPQDHLGLPLRTGQLGLGVHGPGQVADDEHQQLVPGVAVTVVRLLTVLQVRARDLDRELGPVRPPRDHPRRLGPAARVHVIGAPHGAGDEPGVELRQQVEQAAPDERGPRRLEGLQGDGVRVDDGSVGVDQDQRVGQRVEYGCEASSASGWPAAHETLPPCYRTLPTARAILPSGPQRVTRGSLRARVALATPDEREVARGSDDEHVTVSAPSAVGPVPAPRDLRRTFAGPVRHR